MIGDAIRKAAEEVFDKQSREFKDIILITDGEEHEGYESFPVQAAEKAAAEGVRIIAIGLGDENEGSRIPITGPNGETTFLKYKGEEVWTKLGGDLLRNIVYVTDGGKYLSVGPGTTLDLGQIYEKQNMYDDARNQYNRIVSDYSWSSWADLAEKKILLLKNLTGEDKV